jgi:hypothetical protein
MAKKNNNVQLFGIALMVLGLGLGYWGYEMSQALGSQLSQAFTGSAGDAVMQRYIGGAVSFAMGAYLFFKR